MYYGDISCREDILREFCISSFEGHVVYAFYEYEDYSGTAFVIFIHDGNFYLVQGSHCSCYGLEDQWEPEEMTGEALAHMIRNGRMYGFILDKDFANVIERLDELLRSDSSDEQIKEFLAQLT